MLIPNKFSGYFAGQRIYPGGGGKGGGPTTTINQGGSAPPDPRLIEAQIRSMDYQDRATQQMMRTADDLMPLQKEQMRFAIDSSKDAYTQSQQDRAWGLARRDELQGLQARQMQDANDFNVGNRANQLAEEAMQGVNNSFANAQGMTGRAMMARGINPNSGAAMSAMNDNALAQAVAAANAGNKVREAARQEGYGLTDRAANSRMGFQGQLAGLTGAGATFGGSGLGFANSGLSGMNAGYAQAGGMGGSMGSNATGMFGAQASQNVGLTNAQVSNNNSIRQANSQNSDPFGAILGQGMGAFAAKTGANMAFSDRRLKKNIKLVGKTDSGLNIYSFQYKSGGPTVMGVMADEVEKVMPAAVHKRADGEFDAVDYAML